MTTEDTALLADLRGMWQAADPPPAGLAETMIATVAAADLDEELELLVLIRDSANEPAARVRGLGTARVLYFRAVQGWTLDAEIDGEVIRGQLLDYDGDMSKVEVSLETKSGDTWTSGLDEVGFFGLVARPEGFIRFCVRQGKTVSSSRWVEV
jgi:hypothetical protein